MDLYDYNYWRCVHREASQAPSKIRRHSSKSRNIVGQNDRCQQRIYVASHRKWRYIPVIIPAAAEYLL